MAFFALPCPSCYSACVPLLVGPGLYLEGRCDNSASRMLAPGSRFPGQPGVGCSGISLSPPGCCKKIHHTGCFINEEDFISHYCRTCGLRSRWQHNWVWVRDGRYPFAGSSGRHDKELPRASIIRAVFSLMNVLPVPC